MPSEYCDFYNFMGGFDDCDISTEDELSMKK